jgi:ABC-type amino acid transport substrate-binding protein/gamma-glutamylcyclotransferase (GGCT)/AIG2-like uncharacterized protein YtfP
LSRSPTIKWDYSDTYTPLNGFEVRVKLLKSGETKTFPIPERIHQSGLAGITGAIEISVDALMAGRAIRKRRRGRAITTEVYRDSIERLHETGVMRVAVHADPGEEIFCFLQNGRWQGFDIDLSTIIASELQTDPSVDRPIKIEYVFYEWPAIIGSPHEHLVDMAIASISVSAERAKKYRINFSAPYAESALGVIAYSQTFGGNPLSTSVSLDDLRGKTIAVHSETTETALIEKAMTDDRYRDLRVVAAADNDELRELLRDNEVDAVIYDYQRAFTLLDTGAVVYKLNHDIDVPGDRYGIALSRVNSSLSNKVDAIIQKHRLRLAAMLSRRTERKRRLVLFAEADLDHNLPEKPAGSRATNVFVYGSLMYDAVWSRLVSRQYQKVSARLSGYRRLKIKDEDYPGLVKGIGVVRGIVWLGLDDETLARLDRFEADCYERVTEIVVDDDGNGIQADCYRIKESARSVLLEDADWDEDEFERTGLQRFVNSYSGFRE